jgi:hypothetical protein
MKRRGFLKFLAAAPIAIAVKPPKKKKYVHRAPKITDEEILKHYYDVIDKMQIRAVAEIQAEEDRCMFEVMYKAAA